MKSTLYLFLVLFMLTACVDKKKEYTLEGYLMASCDVPAANREVILYQQPTTLTSNGGYLKSFTSDSNGYFKVVYNPENPGKLSFRSNGKIIEGIPSRKNLKLGKVYVNPPDVRFVVRLQVNNPHTANDTLYYYDWNYPQNGTNTWVKRVPGPFESGIIDTVLDAGYMKLIQYNQDPKMSVNYSVKNVQPSKDAEVTTPFCTEEFSEAVLVID